MIRLVKYKHILNGDVVNVTEVGKLNVSYTKLHPVYISGSAIYNFAKPIRIFEQFYKKAV